ncbi:MAG TPA: hypothetical protein VG843_03485 [Rhizomicrobium sp.]|jgi:hypothetical protein|nr:hypothetical protein [Rhizomicrobium sp.]
MRAAVKVLTLVFAIPLLALGWMYASGRKCVIVRNDGSLPVSVQIVDSDGVYVERTQPRRIAAQDFAWIIFRPQVGGALTAVCVSAAGLASASLAAVSDQPMFSSVSFRGCYGRAPVRRTAPESL